MERVEKNVLTIDGSYGEGGGQIIRTAVALSVLTNQPIQINNIRANRPVPGLRPQHYTALSCIKTMCGADVEGLKVHSTKLTFTPHELTPGHYSFDVGTAGSMTLVLQACLLSALHTKEPLSIKLRGGTDVRWAPSWDYFSSVFLPLLHKLGVKTEIQLIKRGYYPSGGGEALLTIFPSEDLQSFHAEEPLNVHELRGIIHLANLPDHISNRMKHAVMNIALKHRLQTSLQVDARPSSSQGTGITLWSASESTILGVAVLGEKGITAEQVGEQATNQLLQEIRTGATIDHYGIDQILPYLAVAPKGSVCLVHDISNHTHTNMWLLKQFLDVDFVLTQQQDVVRIIVE
jgi:RNA 3'-phosphate cyclase